MLDILTVLIVVASSIWIYLDATSHKIGKVDSGGLFNISAGLWATATLLIWIIAFPAYLIKRKQLIETAKENPVEVNGRGWKTGVLSVIGGLWFLLTLAANTAGNPAQPQQQAATEPQTTQTTSNVLSAGAVVCETYKSAMKVWAIDNTGNPYVNIPNDCIHTSVVLPYQSREDLGSVSKVMLGNEDIGYELVWTLPQYLSGN